MKIENSGATIADQLLPTNEVLQPVISSFSKKKKVSLEGRSFSSHIHHKVNGLWEIQIQRLIGCLRVLVIVFVLK